jgi:CDP-glucose 4,6-dehydratase
VINEGNSRVLREYIYIKDLVDAYQFLAERLEEHYSEEMPRTGRRTYGWSAYNVGSYAPSGSFRPEDCANIRNVTQVIGDISRKMSKGHLSAKIIPKDVNFIEIPDQYLDSSKLMKRGFKTAFNLSEGLDDTIRWYTDNWEHLRRLGDKYLR